MYGICTQTMLPLRESPSDKSQMINQLLFGDLYTIKDKLKDWYFIETIDDKYESWIDSKQANIIEQADFELYRNAKRYYSMEESTSITDSNQSNLIRYTLGSSLPLFENGSFTLNGVSHQHMGESIAANKKFSPVLFAKKYLNAPYLWGGRSLYGIDCSGLSQIAFKVNGIMLPRDSSDQIKLGESLNFIEEAKEDDLAFFENDEGKIIHVGIMMDNQNIIHSSGKVRIDKIDHNGIFNEDINKYSHKLRLIKRVTE